MSDEWKSNKGSGKEWNPRKDADGNAVHKPKEGENYLDGYLVGQKDGVGKHNASVYTFRDKTTGEEVDVFGDTILNKELTKIRKGTYVRILYHGRQFNKANQNAGPRVLFTNENSYNNWEIFTNTQVPPLDIAGNDPFESAPTKDVAQSAPIAKGATAGVDFTAKMAKDNLTDDLPF